jgi:GNAT superfamily N-acetyltransferase
LSPNAKEVFSKGNTPEKILELSRIADIFVAEISGRIVVIISGRDNNRINRLFVDKKFQGRGIARKLMNVIEKLYKKRGAKTIHIRSSLYALNFYLSLGYKKSTRLICDKHGMIYQPVIKKYHN